MEESCCEALETPNIDPELVRLRERVQRVKCICLHKMGLPILTNVSNLKPTIKKKLVDSIEALFKDGGDLAIIKEFNEVCNETIWEEGSDMYLEAPVYDR